MSFENILNSYFDIEIKKLLISVAEDEGLRNYQIKKSGGTMKGDGYLGIITAVEISGLSESKEKVLELVVKSASKSDALRVEAPISDVFQREVYMYNTIIPAFQKFQAEKGLLLRSSFAKCYKATIVDKSEALILENLKSSGFKLWERRLPMDEEHVELVMSEYGRFHALSFALKNQNPEKFEKLTDPMGDLFKKFLEKNDFSKMFTIQCDKAAQSLDPVQNAVELKVFKNFVNHAKEFLHSMSELADHYSVVLHGDCWTNNMMFGYDDAVHTNKPTKMRFIDLQISKLGPPILDVSYFFYACSSKSIISNFQHYLDIYYNSLSDTLKKLGSDPDKVYPKSVFRRQWRESARFGLLMSMYVIKIMLSEQDEVVDLADAAESGVGVLDAFSYDIAKTDVYNDRVKHIILHFVNNRFI